MNETDEFKGDTPLATDPLHYDREAMHRDSLRTITEDHMRASLSTPEQADAYVAENWLPVFRRYDLLGAEVQGLGRLAAMSHDGPPSAEDRAGWVKEAKAALLGEYGAEGVGQALADARAFIKQDPQLRRFEAKGFGDHPRMVLMAARLGTAGRKAGKLK